MNLLSEYYKKEHLFSGIDARVKLLMALALLTMVLTYKGLAFPLITAALCLLLCLVMRVPLRVFLLRFSEPVFIALVIVLLKLFTGKDVFFSFSFLGLELTCYRDGLMEGLAIAFRIAGAVSVLAVLGFSTTFNEIMSGLAWLRVPRIFIEILMFAYRYIFLLFEDAMVIYNAQKNRLGYSNIRRGLSSFGILAGSLTLKAFENSQNTTVAMVQRGYDGNIPMLRHKPFRHSEVIASLLFIILMGAIWGGA